MYKNLNAEGLGISGRQNELIELTLTYGFQGFDLDLADLVRRSKSQGLDQARRLLKSAKMKIGGFELPVRWRGAAAEYQADLAQLAPVAEAAAVIGAERCYTTVLPACDDFPYHENFELHCKRIAEMAAVLAPHGVQLGLSFVATAADRQGRSFQFIRQPDALLLLIKSIRLANVGLALDTWHWTVGGGTLDQIRELGGQQIVTVRLADLPADADATEATETQRVLPGDGASLDHVGLLTHLASVDYGGPITAYAHPGAFVGQRRDAIVQRASAALDSLISGAGITLPGRAAIGVDRPNRVPAGVPDARAASIAPGI